MVINRSIDRMTSSSGFPVARGDGGARPRQWTDVRTYERTTVTRVLGGHPTNDEIEQVDVGSMHRVEDYSTIFIVFLVACLVGVWVSQQSANI
jgi:hypothetical protein